MKKIYENPEINITSFEAKDVITLVSTASVQNLGTPTLVFTDNLHS